MVLLAESALTAAVDVAATSASKLGEGAVPASAPAGASPVSTLESPGAAGAASGPCGDPGAASAVAAGAAGALLFMGVRLSVTPTPPQTPWAKFTVAEMFLLVTLHAFA